MWIVWQNYSNNNWEICALSKDAVGIREGEAGSQRSAFRLRIWPNPAKSNIRLQMSGDRSKNSRIQIYDVTGKLVKAIRLAPGVHRSNNDIIICLRELETGTYFLKLQRGEVVAIEKLLIIK
jgi:hypothetical protein